MNTDIDRQMDRQTGRDRQRGIDERDKITTTTTTKPTQSDE